MARVDLHAVTKRFDEVTAVDGVDLTVADGELLVLLGPSGCGKSTLMRLIAGLERPTEGSVAIGELIVDDVPPAKRDVAMVFQSYALYPHKTVRQNIEVPLRTRKVPKAERAAAVDEAARPLGLIDLLDRKPGQLSGGQRQRVALARAMVRRPAVFLLDEPLSNLDASLRVQMRAELVGLHDRLGTTFVHVTHDQVEAMTMADRVAILDRGRLQQVGAPGEIYERPANRMVAGFLGSPPMNLLHAHVGSDDHGIRRLRVGTQDLGPTDQVEGELTVGARPEHLRLTESGPLRATVELVEELGHEHLVRAALPDGQRIVIRTDSEARPPAVSAPIGVEVRADRLHHFDARTGLRLETPA